MPQLSQDQSDGFCVFTFHEQRPQVSLHCIYYHKCNDSAHSKTVTIENILVVKVLFSNVLQALGINHIKGHLEVVPGLYRDKFVGH